MTTLRGDHMNDFEKIKKFLDEHGIAYCTAVDFKLSKIVISYADVVIWFTIFMDDAYKTIVHIEVNGKKYAKMCTTADEAIRYLSNLFCPGERLALNKTLWNEEECALIKCDKSEMINGYIYFYKNGELIAVYNPFIGLYIKRENY